MSKGELVSIASTDPASPALNGVCLLPRMSSPLRCWKSLILAPAHDHRAESVPSMLTGFAADNRQFDTGRENWRETILFRARYMYGKGKLKKSQTGKERMEIGKDTRLFHFFPLLFAVSSFRPLHTSGLVNVHPKHSNPRWRHWRRLRYGIRGTTGGWRVASLALCPRPIFNRKRNQRCWLFLYTLPKTAHPAPSLRAPVDPATRLVIPGGRLDRAVGPVSGWRGNRRSLSAPSPRRPSSSVVSSTQKSFLDW